MDILEPVGKTSLEIPGLGKLEGLIYANGVRQFFGIPYARLLKRWTRAALAAAWNDGYHDGTELGPSPVNPPEFDFDINPSVLLPFGHFPHLKKPVTDELNCLVLNITLPPSAVVENSGPIPVMTFIHGGAFIYGSGNRSVYDHGKLVSHSVKIGKPVVAINFNYRVGFCGFLASKQIRAELQADGLSGNGNFGFSDQRLALEWIHKYVGFFGGSAEEVTIFGCSAGGISVSLHCASENPPPFQRAISMSGCGLTVPMWTGDQHQQIYNAVAKAMNIDPDSPESLNLLRNVSESRLAGAMSLVHGVAAPSCLPCDDGYLVAAQVLHDPQRKSELLPPTLKAYMVGECFDEGMIFCYDIEVDNNDFQYLRRTLADHLKSDDVDRILALYDARPETPLADLQRIMWRMTGDAMFAIPAWLSAHRSRHPKSYAYHFDQQSTMPGESEGLAHHAHDLMYLFGNWSQVPTPAQAELMASLQTAYLRFAYGEEPWESFQVNNRWKIWGPDDDESLQSEEEGEGKRRYSRMAAICGGGLWPGIYAAMDEIAAKRSKIGTKI